VESQLIFDGHHLESKNRARRGCLLIKYVFFLWISMFYCNQGKVPNQVFRNFLQVISGKYYIKTLIKILSPSGTAVSQVQCCVMIYRCRRLGRGIKRGVEKNAELGASLWVLLARWNREGATAGMVGRGNVWGEVVGKPEGNTPLVRRPVLDGIILQNRKCTCNTD